MRPRHFVLAAAGAAVIATGAIIIATTPGSADTGPLPGVEVPASYLPYIEEAAASCTALAPPKVAGHVMEESGLSPTATATSSGGSGLAGLTNDEWNVWQPWIDADALDPRANFLALGHRVCDLVGQVRVANLIGDPWALAVAAYHTSLAAVTEANGVPNAARDYVDRVMRYSAWYALQPEFGGPLPTPPAADTLTPTASATAPTASATSGPSPGSPPTPAGGVPPSSRPLPQPATTTTPPAPTGAPPLTRGALYNDESRRCLSADRGLDGTHLIVTACDGSAVQHWQPGSDGTLRTVGLCMDAANARTANYTPVQVATCSGNPAQRFVVDQNNHIYSSYADKCVNIAWASGPGTSVVLFSCLNQGNQIFMFKQQ
jgi:hypothetical protein